MTVAIAATPASGSVITKGSFVRINVTGASANDASTFDEDDVPTMEPIPYRLTAEKSGQDTLVSHEFVVSSDGKHEWDNVMFPDDGSWSIKLVDQRDDSTAATLSLTVVDPS